MRKVSIKVFISTLLALFIASFIPRTLDILRDRRPDNFREITDLQETIFVIIAFTILLFVFNYFMNQIIVKRIKQLSIASEEVMKGNYEVELAETGKDEITEVISNFNQMTKALKSNEYLNRDFVRNVSHEFKTPLSIIKGYAELIESSDTLTKEERDSLHIIIKESNRLSSLSANMMLLSLVDNTTIVPIKDTFNISKQIRSIIQMMQLQWEAKNLDFDLELPNITIISNKELMYHVLLNIIGNAIKFSDENEQLRIQVTDETETFHIKVSNKGQEIPKSDFDKVFQLFYIANPSRSNKSTGVGLTLTKKIIDKLHGTITFESTNGQTTFYLTLPKNTV